MMMMNCSPRSTLIVDRLACLLSASSQPSCSTNSNLALRQWTSYDEWNRPRARQNPLFLRLDWTNEQQKIGSALSKGKITVLFCSSRAVAFVVACQS